MIEKLKRYVARHEKEEPTNITLKKKINSLENEITALKEMIVEDQYEIRRLKVNLKKVRSKNNGWDFYKVKRFDSSRL